MSQKQTRRERLLDCSDLVPKSNPSQRISVPWTAEEQKAIQWLRTTAPNYQLTERQKRMRNSSAAMILKTLSGDELRDLVELWKSRK